ncbi:hypothetical protein MRB53_015112 [Persea americana]|uniref:Uncharacterized protein n=1 Tax=Persea americana TaxID=3435 RepID=A0ACC2KCV0_PERAE|nr:hypothetical protein MRB53_015112 [Persea americana]
MGSSVLPFSVVALVSSVLFWMNLTHALMRYLPPTLPGATTKAPKSSATMNTILLSHPCHDPLNSIATGSCRCALGSPFRTHELDWDGVILATCDGQTGKPQLDF